MAREVDPFEVLKTHTNTQLINTWMCPWLIAVYGKHFTQRDVADVAMEMLEEVIVRHEVGGFMAETFNAALVGNHMKLLRYARFILRTIGKVFDLFFNTMAYVFLCSRNMPFLCYFSLSLTVESSAARRHATSARGHATWGSGGSTTDAPPRCSC